jgi:mannose-1-phosphate guanylyltransferase/phosphomannomutase
MKAENKSTNHALILAGGRGTRSENPSIPKILQGITGEKTLLNLHLDSLRQSGISRTTFLLGHLNEIVIDALIELDPKIQETIDWVIDEDGDTPVTAVHKAISREPDGDSIFILILGDIMINVDFERHISSLRNSDHLGTVLVHPNLHPRESDVFEFGVNNSPTRLCLKGMGLSGEYPTRAIAGVYFLKKESVALFNLEESDIAKGVIAPLFAAGALSITNSFEYFQDTGTSGRLAKARRDFESGAYERRRAVSKKCIFLDRDGTVIPNLGENRTQIQSSDVSRQTTRSIADANQNGIPVVLITNQPGIAKGFITESDFLRTQFQLEAILNENSALLDDFVFCPHHPETGFEGEVKALKIACDCRKPKTGMIEKIHFLHNIDIQGSVFIGDSEVDAKAAQSLGMEFLKVESNGSENPDLSALITQAIRKIKS